MNLLLWTADVTAEHVPLMESIKALGYDGVELPIFAPDAKKFALLGKHLDDLGLERSACTIRAEADNPISPDARVREKGFEANKAVLDSCAAAGVHALVGPFHSALGSFSGAAANQDEWKWGVEEMRRTAEYAAERGVVLGLECLNRFECYLLGTHADTARFTREVDHPNCRMIYDTFHANIEEKNVAEAIRSCADVLAHVHICENDRSTPGSGGVRWQETFDTLSEVGYDGWMVVEAFGSSLPELVAATKIWRKMYESEEQLARDALAFMKQNVAERWSNLS
jgi:D-psicose/D-tagatose/L-ribulose 3-epimerase